MKYLKYALYAVVALVVLLVAAVAIIASTFDPNSYKPQIVQLVKDKTGRTLIIDGDISSSSFPRLELRSVRSLFPNTERTRSSLG